MFLNAGRGDAAAGTGGSVGLGRLHVILPVCVIVAKRQLPLRQPCPTTAAFLVPVPAGREMGLF